MDRIDIEMDEFANFMFLKNDLNTKIDFSLVGIENNIDFFYFCVELLCKGLFLLYSKDGNIKIDDITHEEFNLVQEKMSLAGILIKLELKENNNKEEPNINSLEMHSYTNDTPLDDLIFRITTFKSIYNVHFELLHIV